MENEPTEEEMDAIEAEGPMPEVLHDFDNWMNQYVTENEVYTIDIVYILWSLFARLRTSLTFDELHDTLHEGLNYIEARLQRGDAMKDADGNVTNVLLAEERAVLGQDSIDFDDMVAMLEEAASEGEGEE